MVSSAGTQNIRQPLLLDREDLRDKAQSGGTGSGARNDLVLQLRTVADYIRTTLLQVRGEGNTIALLVNKTTGHKVVSTLMLSDIGKALATGQLRITMPAVAGPTLTLPTPTDCQLRGPSPEDSEHVKMLRRLTFKEQT